MPIYPPLPQPNSRRNRDPDPRERLQTAARWIAVASALVALLTKVVQLLVLVWRELPWREG